MLDFIIELKSAIKQLKQARRSRKPLSQREVIYNWTEVAAVVGVSRMSIYRYRRDIYPNVPALPTLKSVIRRWAEKYGLPRKPGPTPGHRRRQNAA